MISFTNINVFFLFPVNLLINWNALETHHFIFTVFHPFGFDHAVPFDVIMTQVFFNNLNLNYGCFFHFENQTVLAGSYTS